MTATRCVDFDSHCGLALGDYQLQFVETASGQRFRVSPMMIDPVSDLAVLGFPDSQEFGEDCQGFQDFVDETLPLEVAFDDPSTDDKLHIYMHLKSWIHGRARVSDLKSGASSVFVEMDQPVLGGTSGSAVLNQCGKAVAVVSVFSDPEDDATQGSYGKQPIISMCLLKFLYDAISSSQNPSEQD